MTLRTAPKAGAKPTESRAGARKAKAPAPAQKPAATRKNKAPPADGEGDGGGRPTVAAEFGDAHHLVALGLFPSIWAVYRGVKHGTLLPPIKVSGRMLWHLPSLRDQLLTAQRAAGEAIAAQRAAANGART